MTSRELVKNTLEFKNIDSKAPKDLWILPWAEMFDAKKLNIVRDNFNFDFTAAPGYYAKKDISKGEQYEVGEYIDAWGCKFDNYQAGIIGEVKNPPISSDDEDWENLENVHIPTEWLSINKDKVNEFCASTDKFVFGNACPRPFEQLQFLRGTEQFYMDLITEPDGMIDFMKKMHEFYKQLLTVWAETDVDALNIMDDWGSQRALLINPKLWDKYFAPMYRDYINIAHSHNKKIFMHSDGYILDIIPKLIDLGLDAINSQIFCMGLENLEKFAGRITFWGEIDRQQLLPHGSPADIDAAVRSVYKHLWKNGGCIAQCEYGAGANGNNVYQVYQTWEELAQDE